MNYKIQFENNLKEMERYIRDAKMAYKSFRNKKDIADDEGLESLLSLLDIELFKRELDKMLIH